jgi:D-arginine dehydrogenase
MDCDFLVVGGGIAGISAAARLSGLGRVVLLEAEDRLAHHASSRSAALYEPRYGLPPVVALSLAGGDYLREANGGVLGPRGLMIVAQASEQATFEADAEVMAIPHVSVEAACAMVPVLNPAKVAFAAHADHAWDIDTDKLIQDFLRIARKAGAEVRTKAGVRGIEALPGGGWRVETASEVVTGRFVVNAAGPWADDVAAMAGVQPLGLVAYRRSMARIPSPGGHDPRHWPMIFGAGETWYAKPDAGALIVSPAEEHAMAPHDAFADDMVLAEGLARYEEMVTEPVTRLLANWAGLRTFAPDRSLVIGPDLRKPDFLWFAGQGGYGFQTAPGASRLLADLVAGHAPEIEPDMVAALSPGRFG